MRYEITTKYVEPQPSLTIRVTAPADMLGAIMADYVEAAANRTWIER